VEWQHLSPPTPEENVGGGAGMSTFRIWFYF
jgi:hypothetical protein